MATDVILPALGMSQDTGKIIQWLKSEGEQVVKGEPLVEIETDKATVEIEAPANGVLARVSAAAGEDIPVGQVIAAILAPEEVGNKTGAGASPLASRIAAENKVDLNQVKSAGRRIQKADVLTYLQNRENADANVGTRLIASATARLTRASPKARRLAFEQGKDLAAIKGTGPQGAVLAADVLAATAQATVRPAELAGVVPAAEMPVAMANGAGENDLAVSNIWRIMAERTTQGWTSVPHFYLVREVNVSRLISWREQVLKRSAEKITYTDLLVKIVAAALRMHQRVNASWHEGRIILKQAVNVGLAVAVEEGLVVPVIQQADTLGLGEIARRRVELVAKAQAGKLRPQDISDGTFTISNLGMYNVDAFNAIINQPQAAILAVGRIAERVVPINGQPAVHPMMVLTLSCDHRVVDGARGAQFLDTVATLVEEPLGLLA